MTLTGSMSKPPIEFTPKQRTLVDALRTRDYSYLLFGGGAGGAKTFLGAVIMLNYAMQYPNSQIGVFRRNMPALKRTTYRTFLMVADLMGIKERRHYKNNRKDGLWEFENGSVIFFMDLDDRIDPDFNRAKGLELSCAFIDEANEVAEDGFTILRTRIGRRNQHGGHAFLYLTCNPDQNWVKTLFYDPWQRGDLESPFYYLQSLVTDNPHLGEDYIEQLQELPEAWRERYLNGNWDYADEDNTLFKMRYLLNSLIETPELMGNRRIGADIAREGDDDTVFCLIDNETIIDLFHPKISKNTTDPILVLTANHLEEYAAKHSCQMSDVQIDTVGLGAGVYDILRSRGHAVRGFKSGYASSDPKRFGSLRDEAFYEMAQAVEGGSLKIWRRLKRWESLRQDLIAHSLDISDKLIRVESKKTIKKRIGRSPDDADAAVIAWYRPTNHGVYVPKRPRLPRMTF